MGIVRRWERAKAAAVIAECGTGKTFMALSALHVHSAGRPYAALIMAPPNIVGKWCREVLITIPGARVFMIDGLRTPGRSSTGPHGVSEVRYRKLEGIEQNCPTFGNIHTQLRRPVHVWGASSTPTLVHRWS